MRQLGPDFADYWLEFKAIYETAVQTAFGRNVWLASLRGSVMGYDAEMISAAAVTGYELEVSPGEAVGLMVIMQAYAFTAKHGKISRLLRPSLRERARDHDSMLKAVSQLINHLSKQPIIAEFMERMMHHFKQDLERRRLRGKD